MALLYSLIYQMPILTLLGFGFWVWMIYDCATHDPDRHTWMWILFFLNIVGAILYFFARARYRMNLGLPSYFNPWLMRRKLWTAEAAAVNIGKAHQYAELGDILYDARKFDKAQEAYRTALEKEPTHIKALWGMASLEVNQKSYSNAKTHLQSLLQEKPDFNYGDALLLYGQVLVELEELEAAQIQLSEHIRSWGNPPGYLLLAQVYEKQGDRTAARELLEKMMIKVKGSPPYYYKRNRQYIYKAEKMLKALKHSG
jgi:tetratricopeptide (TPR) repeat protein